MEFCTQARPLALTSRYLRCGAHHHDGERIVVECSGCTWHRSAPWIAGLLLWFVGHMAAVWAAKRDPDFVEVVRRHLRIPGHLNT
jgi:hypothetical protein